LSNLFAVKNDKVEGMSRPKVARTHFHEDVLILNSQQPGGSIAYNLSKYLSISSPTVTDGT
jgi:hypothetical protein